MLKTKEKYYTILLQVNFILINYLETLKVVKQWNITLLDKKQIGSSTAAVFIQYKNNCFIAFVLTVIMSAVAFWTFNKLMSDYQSNTNKVHHYLHRYIKRKEYFPCLTLVSFNLLYLSKISGRWEAGNGSRLLWRLSSGKIVFCEWMIYSSRHTALWNKYLVLRGW